MNSQPATTSPKRDSVDARIFVAILIVAQRRLDVVVDVVVVTVYSVYRGWDNRVRV